MPKDQRVSSLSNSRAKASPYPSGLNDANPKRKSSLPNIGDEKEWEETRCPICLEHPHNAVLLICSSLEKCSRRVFICDTSYRPWNCLDQFRKSFAVAQSISVPVANFAAAESTSVSIANTTSVAAFHGIEVRPLGDQQFDCPLCGGQILGYVVIEPAREIMDLKPRRCSLETCKFTGTYAELRKHAREEHPNTRPSEVDPRRQSDTINAYEAQLEKGDDVGKRRLPDWVIEYDMNALAEKYYSGSGSEYDSDRLDELPERVPIFHFENESDIVYLNQWGEFTDDYPWPPPKNLLENNEPEPRRSPVMSSNNHRPRASRSRSLTPVSRQNTDSSANRSNSGRSRSHPGYRGL